MKQKLTNLTTRALPLEDGTILAAAGTDGCSKQVETISESDARRLADMIHVSEVEPQPARPAKPAAEKESPK